MLGKHLYQGNRSPRPQQAHISAKCLKLLFFSLGVGVGQAGLTLPPLAPNYGITGLHHSLCNAKAQTQGRFHPGPVLLPAELHPSPSFFLSSPFSTQSPTGWTSDQRLTCVGF